MILVRRRISSPPILAALLALPLLGSPVPAQDRAAEVVSIDGRDWSLETSAALPWAEAEEYCETLE